MTSLCLGVAFQVLTGLSGACSINFTETYSKQRQAPAGSLHQLVDRVARREDVLWSKVEATAISLDLRHGVVVDGVDQLIALPGLDQTLCMRRA